MFLLVNINLIYHKVYIVRVLAMFYCKNRTRSDIDPTPVGFKLSAGSCAMALGMGDVRKRYICEKYGSFFDLSQKYLDQMLKILKDFE